MHSSLVHNDGRIPVLREVLQGDLGANLNRVQGISEPHLPSWQQHADGSFVRLNHPDDWGFQSGWGWVGVGLGLTLSTKIIWADLSTKIIWTEFDSVQIIYLGHTVTHIYSDWCVDRDALILCRYFTVSYLFGWFTIYLWLALFVINCKIK